jgi:hypothetical protein
MGFVKLFPEYDPVLLEHFHCIDEMRSEIQNELTELIGN